MIVTPTEKIEAARSRARAERQQWEQENRRQRLESEELGASLERDVFPYLQPARSDDYDRWLGGYLKNGGEITHARERPFPTRDWYVARGPFTLPPLCGSQSLKIIIPVHINVLCPDPGHSQLYWMDGFRAGVDGQHFPVRVPVFSNTKVM